MIPLAAMDMQDLYVILIVAAACLSAGWAANLYLTNRRREIERQNREELTAVSKAVKDEMLASITKAMDEALERGPASRIEGKIQRVEADLLRRMELSSNQITEVHKITAKAGSDIREVGAGVESIKTLKESVQSLEKLLDHVMKEDIPQIHGWLRRIVRTKLDTKVWERACPNAKGIQSQKVCRPGDPDESDEADPITSEEIGHDG